MKQQPTLSTPELQTPDENKKVTHEQVHHDDIHAYHLQRMLHDHEHWSAMINAWQAGDASTCRCWQMYSANYLACTGNVRWAIDPLRSVWMNQQARDVDVTPLESLQVVMLTHNHKDHVDKQLWERLKHAPVRWLVPAFMRDVFVEVTGIEDQRLTIVTPGQVVECLGLRILPFDGLHGESRPADNGSEPVRLGVPSMGYQLQWRGRTWLFPGDTRTYDARTLASLRSPDVLFSHVWLGRSAAGEAKPPLLEAFVSFIKALSPRERVVLAHLYETSRPPSDCWSDYHARLIAQGVSKQLSSVHVVWPSAGEVIEL